MEEEVDYPFFIIRILCDKIMVEDENKESVLERLRKFKEKISDWKDSKLDPYIKHTVKPFAKRVKKNAQRSYKHWKKDRHKRKLKELKARNKPSIKIGTIGNVEALVVNGKVIQNKNAPQLPPNNMDYRVPRPLEYKEPIKGLSYNEKAPQKDNLYRECLGIFNGIQADYDQNRLEDVKENCKRFINYFFSLLSQFLSIEYYGVDDFLRVIDQRGLQFEFYNEALEFSNYLKYAHLDDIHQASSKIFNITNKIIQKLYNIAYRSH